MFQKLKGRIARLLIKNHRSIASWLPSGYRPYNFAGGKIFLDLHASETMLQRLFNKYELPMRLALEQKLSPGSVFVDVGACLGDFSLIAANIVGNSGKVLAFEPEPNNCHWFRKSIELNGYSNINLCQMALGDRNESADLYLSGRNGWHSLRPNIGQAVNKQISISKRRLDDVLEEAKIQSVNMIKIDVEGAEIDVLNGAIKTLSASPQIVVIIEVHHRLGIEFKDVAAFFENFGFNFSPIGPSIVHQFIAEKVPIPN